MSVVRPAWLSGSHPTAEASDVGTAAVPGAQAASATLVLLLAQQQGVVIDSTQPFVIRK